MAKNTKISEANMQGNRDSRQTSVCGVKNKIEQNAQSNRALFKQYIDTFVCENEVCSSIKNIKNLAKMCL